MPRSDIYLKVVVDHDKEEPVEKIAGEICRQIAKIYGVRTAEMSSYVTRAQES